MVKKLTALSLVLLFVFGMLAGCNQNSNPKESTKDTETGSTESTNGDSSKDTEDTSGKSVETKIGYIMNINTDDKSLDFDEIEWLTPSDMDRVEELGLELDPDTDFPNGVYRYNGSKDTVNYKTDENTKFTFLDHQEDFKAKEVDIEAFAKQHNEFYETYIKAEVEEYNNESAYTPYWIEVEDGVVLSVRQQFVP